MMKNKVFVFYNNKTLEVITVFTPNDTIINIDEFIQTRLKYDEKCKGLTEEDISYATEDLSIYNKAVLDFESGGSVSIDATTKSVVIQGVSKDSVCFDNIQEAYEFHIEYNIKAISDIYNIQWLISDKISVVPIEKQAHDMNEYFETRSLSDLTLDIKNNGMYFPFFGHFEYDKFVAEEGTHRANAIKELSGTFMCISKKDGTPFNLSDRSAIESITCYEYEGDYRFTKRTIDVLDYPMFLFVSNNIKMSNEIFGLGEDRFNSFKMINSETNLNRILSVDFIRKNKKFYSVENEDVQRMYDRFTDNIGNFNCKWINIKDLQIEDLKNKDVAFIDPFVASLDNDSFKQELLTNGMMYPFIVYLKDNKYYVAEGYHRYQALASLHNYEAYCIVYDFDKIYNPYPVYAKDYQKDIYIPRVVFPYQEYPYVPGLDGYEIIESDDILCKIKVTNDVQLIQAYKLMPMVMKHMMNFLNVRYGEEIDHRSYLREITYE